MHFTLCTDKEKIVFLAIYFYRLYIYIYTHIAPVQCALCFCRYKNAVGIVEEKSNRTRVT